MTTQHGHTFQQNPRTKRQVLCSIIFYASLSPLIGIIALPVIIAGIAEIVIKKIDPEYFNK